ncbi:MAG: trigger factor [Xanthomonadales bacterium]|jgi:trigger factor|nr:trigger factor [Xanthomonadales bacterium]
MQVSVENTGGLQRRLTVQVPGQEIQEQVESKLKELSKSVRIKGFRPGRVPLSVVRQRYGKQVRMDIVNETMQKSLQQAIRDEDLRPASTPQLDVEPERLDAGDLEFSALIEVYPEIETIEVGSIDLERPEAEITDEDVDDMLQTLREQRKTWQDVERKAQKGDRVLLEYAAEAAEGRVPEEGEQRMAIIMGESGFDDLENALAELDAGESKNLELAFPENFREPKLAGSKVKTELKLVSVSEGELPEVNEEFIKSFGIEGGEVDTLKEEIRGNLARELKQAVNTLLKARLIDALLEARTDLEVPDSIVQQEATGMAAQATRSQDQAPDPAIVQAFVGPARERVKAGLLMGELARQNRIRIDAAKVRQAIETVANTYEQPAEVMQLYYGNQRLMEQVESSVLEEQVVDWVLENAKVTPRTMKFQEVITSATQAARRG